MSKQSKKLETWRAAYWMMQKLGIKFECRLISGDWHPTKLVFNEEQRYYRIAPDQTPPENWREIYKAAQALGVSFDFSRDFTYAWVNGASSFNGEFNEYRLHIEEPPKRTNIVNGVKVKAPEQILMTSNRLALDMLPEFYIVESRYSNKADAEAFVYALEGKQNDRHTGSDAGRV